MRHILETVARDDVQARWEEFRVVSAELRRKTAGRPQTPVEELIREDRDFGHRF